MQERCFRSLKAPVAIVAAYDVPPPMAQPLEAENLPDAAKVMRGARWAKAVGTAPPDEHGSKSRGVEESGL